MDLKKKGKKKLVIPKKFRHQTSLNLRMANRGATSILTPARKIVYWLDRQVTSHALTINMHEMQSNFFIPTKRAT